MIERVNRLIEEAAKRRKTTFDGIVRWVDFDGLPSPEQFIEALAVKMKWGRAAALSLGVAPEEL